MRAQGPLGQDLHKSLQQPGIAGGGRGARGGSFIKWGGSCCLKMYITLHPKNQVHPMLTYSKGRGARRIIHKAGGCYCFKQARKP